MKIKELEKKLLIGGLVTLSGSGLVSCRPASSGCTTCDYGAVDAAPEEVTIKKEATICTRPEQQPKYLVTATRTGDKITVQVHSETAAWKWIGEVAGQPGAVASIDRARNAAVVTIPLAATDTISTTIEINGRLMRGAGADYCEIEFSQEYRVFNSGDSIEILPKLNQLPLKFHGSAAVIVEDSMGTDMLLKAALPKLGGHTLWNVTDGSVEVVDPLRILWHLPSIPGIYQVELVVDYDESGLEFDTLAIEVA